eukprot:13446268-Alexandrium_andersonii.AAC.1
MALPALHGGRTDHPLSPSCAVQGHHGEGFREVGTWVPTAARRSSRLGASRLGRSGLSWLGRLLGWRHRPLR